MSKGRVVWCDHWRPGDCPYCPPTMVFTVERLRLPRHPLARWGDWAYRLIGAAMSLAPLVAAFYLGRAAA